jgi:HAMP domain-containing protein
MLPLDQLETLLRDVSRIATLAHELSNGRVSP